MTQIIHWFISCIFFKCALAYGNDVVRLVINHEKMAKIISKVTKIGEIIKLTISNFKVDDETIIANGYSKITFSKKVMEKL